MSTVGRNTLCPCGSGRKYKRCCGSSKPASTSPPALHSMPVPDLQKATEAMRAGRFLEAEGVCVQLLAQEPRTAPALRLCAELALHLKNPVVALQRARRAVDLAPQDASCHCTLGDAYMAHHYPNEAIAELSTACQLAPDNPPYGHRLVAALIREGRLDDGVRYFRESLLRDSSLTAQYAYLAPAFTAMGNSKDGHESVSAESDIDARLLLACNAFGHALNGLGNVAPAVRACRGGQIVDGTCAPVYIELFDELLRNRRFTDALLCIRALSTVQPDEHMSRHMTAALSGVPLERASPEYCEQLFDRFARQFDDRLVKQLRYAIPQKLAKLFHGLVNSGGSRRWDILDLGCGTGLAGVSFAPMARVLVGVDLSALMLERAQARGVYSRLEKAEAIEFLRREAADSYDLIVATDVFEYFGRLDPVFEEMRRSLRRGGFALFSVEALETADVVGQATGTDYALMVNGRFAQTRSYIDSLAARFGFAVAKVANSVLRTEHAKPARGWLYILKRE